MNMNIQKNIEKSRFEMVEQGYTAYADYKIDGRTLHILYVFSPPELRGQGTAGRLMGGICDYAAAENLKILPICGYAVSWLRKHK